MIANGIQINTKGSMTILKGKTFTQEFEVRDALLRYSKRPGKKVVKEI